MRNEGSWVCRQWLSEAALLVGNHVHIKGKHNPSRRRMAFLPFYFLFLFFPFRNHPTLQGAASLPRPPPPPASSLSFSPHLLPGRHFNQVRRLTASPLPLMAPPSTMDSSTHTHTHTHTLKSSVSYISMPKAHPGGVCCLGDGGQILLCLWSLPPLFAGRVRAVKTKVPHKTILQGRKNERRTNTFSLWGLKGKGKRGKLLYMLFMLLLLRWGCVQPTFGAILNTQIGPGISRRNERNLLPQFVLKL